MIVDNVLVSGDVKTRTKMLFDNGVVKFTNSLFENIEFISKGYIHGEKCFIKNIPLPSFNVVEPVDSTVDTYFKGCMFDNCTFEGAIHMDNFQSSKKTTASRRLEILKGKPHYQSSNQSAKTEVG